MMEIVAYSKFDKVIGSNKAWFRLDDLPNPWKISIIQMTRITVKNRELRCIVQIMLFSLICSRYEYGASLVTLVGAYFI